MRSLEEIRIGIIGLGYVGLPLAVEFGTRYPTVGFDINVDRIKQLNKKIDVTNETSEAELERAKQLLVSNNVDDIKYCNFYIVTVPTPIDGNKQPDLSALRAASEMLGTIIKPRDIIVYESTVYPGATEEICVPILEKFSTLEYNVDFFVGYSPERINPGDKKHRLPNIIKVTSGSTEYAAKFIDEVYSSIITAGTYSAGSIAVAEAAKVVENTQRDVNIALMNELSIIFSKLNIETSEVLEAAATKWNFMKFTPGLVGGHCIGVDPYYLAHKSLSVGYNPEIILSGRRLNDSYSEFIVSKFLKTAIKNNISLNNAKILILGLTFKENCPDIRNTKVVDVINQLCEYGITVDVYDPHCDKVDAKAEYNLEIKDTLHKDFYDGVIIAVAHDYFKDLGADWIKSLCKDTNVIFDLKNVFSKSEFDKSL